MFAFALNGDMQLVGSLLYIITFWTINCLTCKVLVILDGLYENIETQKPKHLLRWDLASPFEMLLLISILAAPHAWVQGRITQQLSYIPVKTADYIAPT